MQDRDGMTILIDHKWSIIAAFMLFLIFCIFGYVILPLLDGIILGLIFAYIARPIKKFLERKGLGIKISSLVATFVIIAPLMGILGLGLIEIINMLLVIAQNQEQLVNSIVIFINGLNIPESMYNTIRDMVFSLSTTVLPMLGKIPISLGLSILMFSLNAIISVFVCFFLLMDGSKFVNSLIQIVPEENLPILNSFIDHFDKILAGIFMGSIYSSIITGTLAIPVLYFFEVPHVLALSALILLAALVPVIAGWMVIFPIAVMRLFEFGYWNAAFFLVVSTLVLYTPTELILKPYIVSRTSNIHALLILLAFIGGGLVGGISGFFMAPIMLGILIAAYRAYVKIGINQVDIFKMNE
ncbi:MAG: AI-2E family transporter [Methanosarcinales archaeon]|nr:AI-2E family transporter [Methanosarcinales archaeon]